jgi:hypothetical protein
MLKAQRLSVPVSRLLSSDTVSIQVPSGFSPMNAARPSSGVSGLATLEVKFERPD